MKKNTILLAVSLGVLLFTSCTKTDCVCTSTSTQNGVVTSSSTSSGNSIINTPGPAGNSSECNTGDNSETYTSGSVTYVNTTECELE